MYRSSSPSTSSSVHGIDSRVRREMRDAFEDGVLGNDLEMVPGTSGTKDYKSTPSSFGMGNLGNNRLNLPRFNENSSVLSIS